VSWIGSFETVSRTSLGRGHDVAETFSLHTELVPSECGRGPVRPAEAVMLLRRKPRLRMRLVFDLLRPFAAYLLLLYSLSQSHLVWIYLWAPALAAAVSVLGTLRKARDPHEQEPSRRADSRSVGRVDPYTRFGRIVLWQGLVTSSLFALGAWLIGRWHDLVWVGLLVLTLIFQTIGLAISAARGKPPFDDAPSRH
jgi:hypothetical protein